MKVTRWPLLLGFVFFLACLAIGGMGCRTGNCITVDGQKICLPTPPPTTTTLPSPSPTPTPVPTPTPTVVPTPGPTPTPTPQPCGGPAPGRECEGVDPLKWCGGCWTCRPDGRWKQHNKACGPGCDDGCGDRWRCIDKQDYDLRQGHVKPAPAGAPYRVFGCPPGVEEVPGCPGGTYLNARCDRVDQHTGRVLAPAEDGYYGICVPRPCPSATPTPAPTPTPSTPPGVCPPLLEMGSSSLGYVDCGKCREQGYVGYRMNWTGTPLRASTPQNPCPPSSEGATRLRCEMPKECQDPRGATIYMSLENGWQNGLCEPKSENLFNCGHKPTPADLGITTFWACPPGAPPNHPQCGPKKRVDVRADRPVELR